MGKTTQALSPSAAPAAVSRQQQRPETISLLPPLAPEERKIWSQKRKAWRQQAQQRAKYWSQEISAAQQRGDSEQQLQALAQQAAEELIAERLDRWRNDDNGYDRLVKELGLAANQQGITEVISGQDQRPEFQQFALHFASQWLAEKAINNNKLTPGYLMEQVSHGANRAYLAELFQEVDDHPEKIAARIFASEPSAAQIAGLQRVAGLSANTQVSQQRQQSEQLPPGTAEFWYQVRKKWQDGLISNRQQLAEYTAEQIERYG